MQQVLGPPHLYHLDPGIELGQEIGRESPRLVDLAGEVLRPHDTALIIAKIKA
jgi:hypothetical protein